MPESSQRCPSVRHNKSPLIKCNVYASADQYYAIQCAGALQVDKKQTKVVLSSEFVIYANKFSDIDETGVYKQTRKQRQRQEERNM